MKTYPALQTLVEELTPRQIELLFNAAELIIIPTNSCEERIRRAQGVAKSRKYEEATPQVIRKLDELVRADQSNRFDRIFFQLLELSHTTQPDSGHPKLDSRWRYIGKGDAKDKIFAVKLLGDLGIVAESVPDIDYPPGYSFEGPYDEFYTKFVPE